MTDLTEVLNKQRAALGELDAHIEEVRGKLDALGDDITAAKQVNDYGLGAVLQGEYKRMQSFYWGLKTARSYL